MEASCDTRWSCDARSRKSLECSFLIPVLRDSDRCPHSPLKWRLLHEALHRRFGGRTGPGRVYAFRSAEIVPGGWIPEGSEQAIEDESRLYRVSVPEDKVDELRSLLRKAANSFDQQTIYLSVRGYVEFVTPRPEDSFLE